MALIEVSGLSRTFKGRGRPAVQAVRDLSFSIEAGEMVGYIGPNGAGKSTTVKMLTGILVPSGGTIRVAGLDPSRSRAELASPPRAAAPAPPRPRVEVASRIGVVFGQRTQLWWDLPLLDSFQLLRHIYRVPADRYRASLARFGEVLDLDPFLSTPGPQ